MSLMDYKKYVKALFETDLKRYERIDRVLNMELKTEWLYWKRNSSAEYLKNIRIDRYTTE